MTDDWYDGGPGEDEDLGEPWPSMGVLVPLLVLAVIVAAGLAVWMVAAR